jgi:DNA-binding transcriptional ArsR family regulator
VRPLVRFGQRMALPQTPDAAIGKVLSHPLRPQILSVVTRRGEASPNEVAGELGAPLGTVSYHVRMLRDEGWLELTRTEQRRGAVEHFYRAIQRPFVDDAAWERLPLAVRRQLAGQTLGLIVNDAAEAARTGGFDAPGSHVDRVRLALDEAGWKELSSALVGVLDEVARIQERSNARAAGGAVRTSQLAVLHHAVTDATG